MYKIGEIISNHRRDKKLSQIELSEKLAAKGVNITNAAISAWEKGNSMPTAESLLAVCEILKINDIYTEFIGENPLDPFRNLNEIGKKKVLEYIDLLEKSGEYEKKTAEIIDITPRLMKIALVPASAGTGNFTYLETVWNRSSMTHSLFGLSGPKRWKAEISVSSSWME